MTIFYLPDLGEGLAEAEIREWYVKEGDTVKIDQPLVSMETAKAVVDVPSPLVGKIHKLHGQSGDIIPTGSPLIEFEGEKDKGTVVGNLEESATVLNEDHVTMGSAKKNTVANVKAMPAVRALAKELHVDLTTVIATGPGGQLTADDVKKAASPKTILADNATVLHGVRRAMAMAMTQSHQEVVPVTLMDDADVTSLFAKTKDLTVEVIRAMVHAAKKVPALNAWYVGKTMEHALRDDVNVGLAVNTEEGLFVPVIKNAEKQTPDALRELINTIKKAVLSRTLPPDAFSGATITLSNFGMLAGRYANPVIVPPQVAILGCGRLREAVLPHEGKIAIRNVLPLSLTFDHRVVTGAEAATFLKSIMDDLENLA